MTKSVTKSDSAIADFSASFIEKAWELRWGIQLTYVVLFLDAALAFCAGKNLMSLSLSTDEMWKHAGIILVGVAAFCLTVSLFIPFSANFFRAIGVFVPWEKLDSTDVSSNRPFGYVLMSELKEHAFKENDDFAWELYKSKCETVKKEDETKHELGVLIFGLGALFCFDAWVGSAQGVATLGVMFGEIVGYSGWVTAFISLIVVLRMTWWAPWKTRWVHYPPLYHQVARVKQI
jgi:hypothetical protein